MKTVEKIENRIPVLQDRKRVAAYARVSVESEWMQHSLSAQISYYSELIQHNPEWEYAGVYADYGVSGTGTKERDEFKRMIADCDAGKIDIILAKSISRFARNTVDLLNAVRHLKDLGIEVRFEKEHINSLSGDGELMLTLLASFAQEESRSISENIKWAVVKGYQAGKPHSPSRVYGYEWDGEKYAVIPKEAAIVRFVFESYLSGKSLFQIADMLNEKGFTGLKGGPFCRSSLKEMIQNEIYTGILLFQKTYSPNVRKRAYNHGEMPMYRVEEAHDPIIDIELFDAVQEEKKRRSEETPNRNMEMTGFSGKVKCGKCGHSCSRRNIPHTKTTQRDYAKRWVCNLSETKHRCSLIPVSEDELRKAAADVLGTDPADDGAFRRDIVNVTLNDDSIDFVLRGGRTETLERSFSRRYSSRTCFSGKMRCGECGAPMIRYTDKNGIKLWMCRERRKAVKLCGSLPLPEDELRDAAISLLGGGTDYETRFTCGVENSAVYKDHIDFFMKDGSIKTWERK